MNNRCQLTDIWHINIEQQSQMSIISGYWMQLIQSDLLSELMVHWNDYSWNQKLWTQLAKKKEKANLVTLQ